MDITAARKLLGLSQGELAVRLGVSQAAVSQWESGKRQPDERVVGVLRNVLGEDGLRRIRPRLDPYPSAPVGERGVSERRYGARRAWVDARNRLIAGRG